MGYPFEDVPAVPAEGSRAPEGGYDMASGRDVSRAVVVASVGRRDPLDLLRRLAAALSHLDEGDTVKAFPSAWEIDPYGNLDGERWANELRELRGEALHLLDVAPPPFSVREVEVGQEWRVVLSAPGAEDLIVPRSSEEDARRSITSTRPAVEHSRTGRVETRTVTPWEFVGEGQCSEATPPADATPCVWRHEGGGYYATQCGEAFGLEEGTILGEGGLRFCCYCAAPIQPEGDDE